MLQIVVEVSVTAYRLYKLRYKRALKQRHLFITFTYAEKVYIIVLSNQLLKKEEEKNLFNSCKQNMIITSQINQPIKNS